ATGTIGSAWGLVGGAGNASLLRHFQDDRLDGRGHERAEGLDAQRRPRPVERRLDLRHAGVFWHLWHRQASHHARGSRAAWKGAERAEALVEIQKKVTALLGMPSNAEPS